MIMLGSASWDESGGGIPPELDLSFRVDRACDEFERSWRAGARPRIEDFLAGVAPAEEPDFLRALLDLEIALARDDARRDYAARFPGHAPIIDEVLAEPPDAEASAEIGPRYEALEPHAEGGMGVIYVAIDHEIGRRVALKRIKEGSADDPSIRERFLREATLTGRLEHPGIVPVYGLGHEADGRPYYAMQFIEKPNLLDEIRRLHEGDRHRDAPPPTLRGLLTRFVAACYTMAYAHDRRVIHRDIKPEHIVLGDYGETLVVDWGLARPIGVGEPEGPSEPGAGTAPEASTTNPGGTTPYMAPEQFQDRVERLGPWTDVFGLGATLYCLLTGGPPRWVDPSGIALPDAREARIRPPRAVAPSVPPALEAICLKALAPEPPDRYESAGALAAEVERWLADEPVRAYPDPLPDRVLRRLRRHRTAAIAAAAALLVAAIGSAVVAVTEYRAQGKQAASNRLLAASNEKLAAANERLRAANEELAAEKEETRSRHVLARDAIALFHRGISEDLMLKHPSLAGLRDRLLGSALGFYDKLVSQIERERHPALDDPHEPAERRRDLAAAIREIGRLSEDIGQPDRALAALERSVDLLSRIQAKDPADLSVALDLAATLADIGNNHFHGARPGKALAAYERSRSLCLSLVTSAPGDRAAQAELARIVDRMSHLLFSGGKSDEAIGLMAEARRLQQGVVDADPRDRQAREDLAKMVYDAGIALLYAGHRDDAAKRLDESSRIREALTTEQPQEPRYRNDLALSLMYIGMIDGDAGRHRAADATLRRAITLQRPLAEAYPGVLKYRSDLSAILDNLAMLRKSMRRPDEAFRLLEEARGLRERLVREDPTTAIYQTDLADTLDNLGRLQAAARHDADALGSFRAATAIRRKVKTFEHFMLYNIACDLAMSIPLVPGDQRLPLADEAMRTLRQAVDRGYRDQTQIVADQDEALASLRDRDDFKRLLIDLAFDDPFAP